MVTGTIRVLALVIAFLGFGGCIVGPQDDFPFEPGVRGDVDPEADSGINAGGGDGDDSADGDADADGPPYAEADGLPDDGAFEAADGGDDEDPGDDGAWNGSASPRFVPPRPAPPVHFGAPFAIADERSDDPAPPDAAEDTDSAITESE